MVESFILPQQSIAPRTDLREMLRLHIVKRSLSCMEKAAARRESAIAGGDMGTYQHAVREAVKGLYGRLPVGEHVEPPEATPVSQYDRDGFRVENVLFDAFPGWQVNATVFVPTNYPPPYPPVVVPVGHSGKQFPSYQLPCQLFARCGFLAIVIDPPGQASEKQPGNDHFHDGVRHYLIGETSSRFFIADALRCIDYLATRDDADLSRGVAMTGVSGGGTSTTFAALLDDRIAVIGPSCCVSPLADLDITQCYAGCPETHMWSRYAQGVDEVDLLCAAAPTPCLLMAGKGDEVFRIEDTRRLADQVSHCYASLNAEERFEFFVDEGGHAYSLTQARQFIRFMNRWLCDDPHRKAPDIPDEAVAMLPYEELRCYPSPEENMRTLAVIEAKALAGRWNEQPQAIRHAAKTVAGVTGSTQAPDAEVGERFQVWTHQWRPVMLRPEPDIELPATFLTPCKGMPAPTLLHFDDGGRHRLLYRQGLLAQAIRFLDRDQRTFNALAVDLRGWGDTTPAVYPYEMAGWGSIDRYLAYATAALGDAVMAMRIRDGLSALAWLRMQTEVDRAYIVLTGCGLGALVAQHVAAIDGQVAGVVVWDNLASFRTLLETEHYTWPADAFLPNVLRYYDLPQLTAAIPCPVRILNPLDGAGQPIPRELLDAYANMANARAIAGASSAQIAAEIQNLLLGITEKVEA